MMIPVDAKVCPFCRKKPSMTLLKFLGVAFAVLFIGTCIAAMNEGSKIKPASITEKSIALTEKGQKIKKKNPDWTDHICNTVGEKRIFIGMKKDQVIAAWGRPERINATTYSWGTHEQWVYGQSYVYFRNDTMESLQQSR